MGQFVIIEGEVTNKQDSQRISGRVHKGTGHVRTKNRSNFMIDSQAVEINGTGGMLINEGDSVLGVGQLAGNGVMHLAAFKNNTSGVVQEGATIVPSILGLSCIGLGVLTFFLVITPIIFIPLGLLSLWGAYKTVKANRLLKDSI
jgi:hypothetical protein